MFKEIVRIMFRPKKMQCEDFELEVKKLCGG
jgi:hypothetical protein